MEPHPPPFRSFVTSLVSSLPSKTDSISSNSNPLKDLDQQGRNLLLTLHVLFPTEFLPALDLLDRGLVTRFLPLGPDGRAPGSDSIGSARQIGTAAGVYHVRSAQQSRSHRMASEYTGPSYEVRLTAWNCSCPAFAFSAFPAAPGELHGQAAMQRSAAELCAAAATYGNACASDPYTAGHPSSWLWGGLIRATGGSQGGSMVPICKHLLACVLVEKCPLFRDFAKEKEVSVEELAGWAADWDG